MALIYKIQNKINNKVYIGKTNRTLQVRWNEHKRYANDKTRTNTLYCAMRKYGINNFQISILENNIPNNAIFEKEQEYIKKYDSYYNGYNETFGGEGESKVDIDYLIKLYDEGNNYKEISKITGHSSKTISTNLKAHGRLPRIDGSPNKGKGKQIIFNDVTYNSLTELAHYLQNNMQEFCNKKIETIIKGISKNAKNNTAYCGYYFFYK